MIESSGNASNSSASMTPLLKVSFIVMVVTAAGYMFATTLADSLYEHLNCGLVFVEAGQVVKVDPWSYVTADKPWLDYNWLFEYILAVAYKSGGVVGLCILKMLLVLSFVGLLYWHLLRTIKYPLFASYVLVAALATLGPFLFAPRPHLITALCFTLLMVVLDNADQGRRKWLFAAPLIMALWCNSHGGWVSGLGIVAIWCAADVIQNAVDQKSVRAIFSKRLLEDFLLGIGCAFAVLVNPYGADLPMFLLKALGGSRSEFADWLPISITTPIGMMYFVWLIFTAFVVVTSKRPKSLRFWALYLTVAVQPLSALRHLLLTIIGFVILCSRYINDCVTSVARGGDPFGKLPQAHQNVLAGSFVLLSLFMMWDVVPKFLAIPTGTSLPREAVDVLKRSGVKGNMATMFDYGDYCIWHLFPNIKVSSDGRREAAYPAKALALNMKFTYGLQDWDELLTKYPTHLALVSRDYATFNLLKLRPGWQLCYEDGQCGIFAPAGSEIARQVSEAVKNTDRSSKLNWTFP